MSESLLTYSTENDMINANGISQNAEIIGVVSVLYRYVTVSRENFFV